MPTEIVHPTGGVPAVCVVRGEIDISNVGDLRAGLDAAFGASPSVVVDLADVTFLASTGVRAILDAAVRPGRRAAVVVGPGVQTVLRICRLDDVVPCAADREAAAALLGG